MTLYYYKMVLKSLIDKSPSISMCIPPEISHGHGPFSWVTRVALWIMNKMDIGTLGNGTHKFAQTTLLDSDDLRSPGHGHDTAFRPLHA